MNLRTEDAGEVDGDVFVSPRYLAGSTATGDPALQPLFALGWELSHDDLGNAYVNAPDRKVRLGFLPEGEDDGLWRISAYRDTFGPPVWGVCFNDMAPTEFVAAFTTALAKAYTAGPHTYLAPPRPENEELDAFQPMVPLIQRGWKIQHPRWGVLELQTTDGLAGIEYTTGDLDAEKELTTLEARWYLWGGPKTSYARWYATASTHTPIALVRAITDSVSDEKMLCPGLAFLPIAAVIDYELTVSMPPRLTADTGVDALTHAIEAYVSKKANPFADSLALVAIGTIGRVLRRAYTDGSDAEAREQMMLAATQAGIAFSNSSVALVHGMSRPIGAHFHVAHGLSNAMLFPAVTAFSVRAAESRYADCARALGVATTGDDDATAANNLVDALRELCRDVAVPTPKAYGIDKARWDELIPLMAEQALASGSPNNNPLVPTDAEIRDLYAQIYG